MSSPSTLEFDLVIAGGAMAGATLALAIEHFTQSGLHIAVVEAVMPSKPHPGYDARSIAIAYGSSLLLEKIGVWQKLSPLASPIKSVHVSDASHFGLTEIHASDEHLPYLGHVIALSEVGKIFHQALEKSTQTTLFCPAFVQHIVPQIDNMTLTLSTGQIIKTKLLIGADGALSSCCKMLDIACVEHDFNQVAMIANITTHIAHQNRAFERFTSTGPIALLPMPQGVSSLVWCVKPEQAKHLLALDDSAFINALQRAFGWRLGRFVHASKREHYPLVLKQAAQSIAHRFAVVGNAAQTLHPIAGQGFNLGLRDVFTLAEEIALASKKQEDIGQMRLLQHYLKRRQPDRNATVAMTSALVYGFSNSAWPLTFGRNLGLAAMSICPFPPFKTTLLKRTMGLVKR